MNKFDTLRGLIPPSFEAKPPVALSVGIEQRIVPINQSWRDTARPRTHALEDMGNRNKI